LLSKEGQPVINSKGSPYWYRSTKNPSDICFSKFEFVAFITMVINCTAGIIEVVVAPAERYLGRGI
jgi:hypothetical protein